MSSREKRDDEREELDPDASPEQDEGDTGSAPEIADLEAAAAAAEEQLGGAEDLRRELAEKAREAAEAQDKYLRTYADFENYRKRMQRDLADFRKYANEQFAQDLLPVVDHLGLALKHAQESGETAQGLREGVQLVYKQLRDVLEKYGVTPFKAEGEPFDPKLHDAMAQVESADAPENTVVRVFQEGYRYHDKVLRHARVGVAKRPAAGACGPEEQDAGGAAGVDPDAED
jgi:molecular chaperone GrpE